MPLPDAPGLPSFFFFGGGDGAPSPLPVDATAISLFFFLSRPERRRRMMILLSSINIRVDSMGVLLAGAGGRGSEAMRECHSP